MIRKYMLPVLSVLGIALAIYTVTASAQETRPAKPVAPPAKAPFENYVAGAGLAEASTENIAIGAVVPGIVKEVFVTVNQQVKAGDPLFRVDDRDLRAQLLVAHAAVEEAKQQLAKWNALPRPEDVPPLEAAVAEAKADLADRERELARLERIGASASRDERDRARFAAEAAAARLDQANAELNRVKVGAWNADVQIARAAVAAAQAQVEAINVEIDRRLVRAPVEGTILQVDVRPGEFAATGTNRPLMLLGNIDTMHVRVDVDENDAWRIEPGAKAVAFIRGNSRLKTDLTFVRIEPFVVPKRSLTGDASERVDTRVLQLIYAFKPGTIPVYVGQQMDVFIDARPLDDFDAVTRAK